MGEIRVGTSGWHYPSGAGTWNGMFYPKKRPRGFDELAYYAEHFDTVEVNASFYRMPESDVTAGWVRRTPASFLFAVKLFQKFTHPDMYLARDGVRDWDLSRADFDLFRAGIAPMAEAGRLAAILVQFPPSFHASEDTRAYLDWLLNGLSGYSVAVELRHRSWSDAAADTRAQLSAKHAAWVLIDEPKFASSIRQSPATALIEAAPVAYVRLHGRNAAEWWNHPTSDDRYNYLYSRDEVATIAETARTAAESATRRRKVLLYFNNHFSSKAVANAAVLKHDLGQIVPGEYPAALVEQYPDLTGIVRTEGRLL